MRATAVLQAAAETPTRARVGEVALLSATHFVHDAYLTVFALLLPLLIGKLDLSYLLTGFLGPIQQAPALAQPALGYAADRWRGRHFMIACVALTGLTTSLIGLAPNYVLLALLLLVAGASSATFHPAGSAALTRAAGNRWGSALAVYHLAGNLGLAASPLLVTAVVARFGLDRSYLIALPAALWVLLLWRTMPAQRRDQGERAGVSFLGLLRADAHAFTMLAAAIFARTIGAGGLTFFLPAYLMERGHGLGTTGMIAGAFYAVGGVGALATGSLSDRLGRRSMLVLILSLAPALLIAFLNTAGPLSLVCLFGAAALLLGEQPVILALVQEIAPSNRGMAAGFVMGAQFAFSGLSTVLVGALADRVGLGAAFGYVALLPWLGVPALLALRVPRLMPAGEDRAAVGAEAREN